MPNGQSRTASKPTDCKRKTENENPEPQYKSPGNKAEQWSAKTEASPFPSNCTSDERSNSQQNYQNPYESARAQLNTIDTGEPEGATTAHARQFYG